MGNVPTEEEMRESIENDGVINLINEVEAEKKADWNKKVDKSQQFALQQFNRNGGFDSGKEFHSVTFDKNGKIAAQTHIGSAPRVETQVSKERRAKYAENMKNYNAAMADWNKRKAAADAEGKAFKEKAPVKPVNENYKTMRRATVGDWVKTSEDAKRMKGYNDVSVIEELKGRGVASENAESIRKLIGNKSPDNPTPDNQNHPKSTSTSHKVAERKYFNQGVIDSVFGNNKADKGGQRTNTPGPYVNNLPEESKKSDPNYMLSSLVDDHFKIKYAKAMEGVAQGSKEPNHKNRTKAQIDYTKNALKNNFTFAPTESSQAITDEYRKKAEANKGNAYGVLYKAMANRAGPLSALFSPLDPFLLNQGQVYKPYSSYAP